VTVTDTADAMKAASRGIDGMMSRCRRRYGHGVLFSRNGIAPRVDPTARVAPTASVVGDVTVGAGCYIDYGVVIASSGPPVFLGEGVTVLANAVIRSVGGHGRPAFPVRIGDESIIAPLVALAGCEIEERCYVATAVVVLQGARVGRGSRLAIGAVVHAGSVLEPVSRVGLHCVAAPDSENGVVITADLEAARDAIARADFFGRAFALGQADQEQLHRDAAARLREEAAAWTDEPIPEQRG
jgi:carbonic anhydrase/acetyltransferase-like protein (isoleucine patch superfamily)